MRLDPLSGPPSKTGPRHRRGLVSVDRAQALAELAAALRRVLDGRIDPVRVEPATTPPSL
ncbi:hypothetical protein [Actinokineospora terrae]|uniref:hypothetical protein n=1 Tax=Actinokineospora terrae TaxID=155974 RepID=UPI001160561F|nr:hypothetical protein [Actinokineospora terrae]